MSDLIYLAVIVGFFAAAFGLLKACEHIVGADAVTATPSAVASSAATDADARGGAEPLEATA